MLRPNGDERLAAKFLINSLFALTLALISFCVNADRASVAQPVFYSNPSRAAWVAPRRPSPNQPQSIRGQTRWRSRGNLKAISEPSSLDAFKDLVSKAKERAAEQTRILEDMAVKQKDAEAVANTKQKEKMAALAKEQIAAKLAAEAAKSAAEKAAALKAAEEAAAAKAAEEATAAKAAEEAAAAKAAEEAAAAKAAEEIAAARIAERDERLRRNAELDAEKEAEASALKLTIPKLKAFIKSQGADLPTGQKVRKADYIRAALEAGRAKMEWAEVTVALKDSLGTQAKGFAGGKK